MQPKPVPSPEDAEERVKKEEITLINIEEVLDPKILLRQEAQLANDCADAGKEFSNIVHVAACEAAVDLLREQGHKALICEASDGSEMTKIVSIFLDGEMIYGMILDEELTQGMNEVCTDQGDGQTEPDHSEDQTPGREEYIKNLIYYAEMANMTAENEKEKQEEYLKNFATWEEKTEKEKNSIVESTVATINRKGEIKKYIYDISVDGKRIYSWNGVEK